MQKIFGKIFIIISIVIFFFVLKNNNAYACSVNSANFRVIDGNGQVVQNTPNGWYRDNNPPFVYIDVQTTGCNAGQTFQLSITELDDADGLNNINDDDILNFDNRIVPVPNNSNFTIVTKSGDDECESFTTHPFDCMYYIRINDNVLNNINTFNQTSNLKYNCHNGCDNKNWEWVGIINYQENHPNDPILIQNQQSGGSLNTTGSVEIAINLQNPIGGGQNMTLVDFIEKIIKFALTVGIPIVAIGIIYSGFLFVTARGNDKQLETAKNAFTYAVIGGAILLASFIFAKLIKDTIETIAMIINYIV